MLKQKIGVQQVIILSTSFFVIFTPMGASSEINYETIDFEFVCPSPKDTSLTNWTCHSSGSKYINDNASEFKQVMVDQSYGNDGLQLYATCGQDLNGAPIDGINSQNGNVTYRCEDPDAYISWTSVSKCSSEDIKEKNAISYNNVNVCDGDEDVTTQFFYVTAPNMCPSEVNPMDGYGSYGGYCNIGEFRCAKSPTCQKNTFRCPPPTNLKPGQTWVCYYPDSGNVNSTSPAFTGDDYYVKIEPPAKTGTKLTFECKDDSGNFIGTVNEVQLNDFKHDKIVCEDLNSTLMSEATKACNIKDARHAADGSKGTFHVYSIKCTSPAQ